MKIFSIIIVFLFVVVAGSKFLPADAKLIQSVQEKSKTSSVNQKKFNDFIQKNPKPSNSELWAFETELLNPVKPPEIKKEKPVVKEVVPVEKSLHIAISFLVIIVFVVVFSFQAAHNKSVKTPKEVKPDYEFMQARYNTEPFKTK